MANTLLVMLRDAQDANKERAGRLAIEECFLYGLESDEALASVTELLSAVRHCEDVFMKYSIDRIDGDEITEEALRVIRSAISRAGGV